MTQAPTFVEAPVFAEASVFAKGFRLRQGYAGPDAGQDAGQDAAIPPTCDVARLEAALGIEAHLAPASGDRKPLPQRFLAQLQKRLTDSPRRPTIRQLPV